MGDAYDRTDDIRRRWGLDEVDRLERAYFGQPDTAPDHFLATAEELEHIASMIRQGTTPEDIAPRVVNLGRIMGRKC